MITLQVITLDAMSSASVEVAMIKFERGCTTCETQDHFSKGSDRQKMELRYIKARTDNSQQKAVLISIIFNLGDTKNPDAGNEKLGARGESMQKAMICSGETQFCRGVHTSIISGFCRCLF